MKIPRVGANHVDGRDPQTKIICLYLESIDQGRDLIETARCIDKPVVVYKSNTTATGEKAAMSHTAALSNDEDIVDAAFEEAGMIRINNFLDFIERCKVHNKPTAP